MTHWHFTPFAFPLAGERPTLFVQDRRPWSKSLGSRMLGFILELFRMSAQHVLDLREARLICILSDPVFSQVHFGIHHWLMLCIAMVSSKFDTYKPLSCSNNNWGSQKHVFFLHVFKSVLRIDWRKIRKMRRDMVAAAFDRQYHVSSHFSYFFEVNPEHWFKITKKKKHVL